MTFKLDIVITPPHLLLVLDKKLVRKVMRQGLAEVAAEARKLLKSAVGDGRVYRGSGGAQYRPYRKGRYTASSPGKTPVSVTGTLLRSIKPSVYKSGMGGKVSAEFYALFLEHGAKGGGKGKASRNLLRHGSNSRSRQKATTTRTLESRPLLSAALDSKRASLSARIAKALSDGVTLQRAP